MEEDENALNQLKGDKAKQHLAFHQHSPIASQPRPISHELNIAELVRTKMEKLERKL